MRIALVSQEYPPETAKGGLGTQTHVKAHGLVRLGHEVHVISRSAGNVGSDTMDGSVRVLRIPGWNARTKVYTDAADWLTYSMEAAAAVAAQHLAHRFDIVEFPEWGAEGYLHLLNRTQWNWIPTVLHLHGPLLMMSQMLGWPSDNSELFRVGTMMEGTCLRLADAVYSSSQCSIDFCARHYGLAADPAVTPVIHMGVNTSLFHPRAAPKHAEPTVLFAGRIVRNKGAEPLMAAILELAREIPGLRLRMAGRGDHKVVERLRNAAIASGDPDILALCGHVAHEHLAAEMAAAHVFAVPSTFEGGPGLVYLEAMACGVPVIACSGSGSSEVIEHERTGLLVPPGDHGALVAALRRLLADVRERETLGAAARRFAVENADTEGCVQRLATFYESVVARHRSQVG